MDNVVNKILDLTDRYNELFNSDEVMIEVRYDEDNELITYKLSSDIIPYSISICEGRINIIGSNHYVLYQNNRNYVKIGTDKNLRKLN